jgi:prevent-host-death family protein
MKWQLQQAKAKLSDVVKKARAEGPQEITVHGETAAYLVSKETFDELRGKPLHWVEFLRSSPLMEVELDLERDTSPPRDVEL